MTIASLLFALIAIPTNTAGPGEPIMLDFTASWCGPCRQMRPVVEQLAQEGYPIKPVDVDSHPDLAQRYHVTGVPAFVVIEPETGRELARTEGARPASELADMYDQAKAQLRPRPPARPRAKPAARGGVEDDPDDDDPAPPSTNPMPWEAVVRIKVLGSGAIGYGSGTVVYSTPAESLILTCAHIFKLEHGPQAPPSRFPRKIRVDLFDGNLSGPKRNQVHYSNETFDGEAVDYDFQRDVGLIRIRPGRRLPYARVVPPHWTPKARMGMITVGCSEGQDATAWNTQIINPKMRAMKGYEAIECWFAPKQGRSGGGLFTTDGYVAGVCDFAEPQGNHGLYASPASIYHLLDRNEMTALYAPVPNRPQTLLAKNRPAPTRRAPEYRLQSPDADDPGAVTLPPPEMLGIKRPDLPDAGTVAETEAEVTSPASRRHSWQPTPSARATGVTLDPSSDPDRFARSEPPPPSEPAASGQPEVSSVTRRPPSGGSWRAVRAPLPGLTSAGDR
jgi:thiol-disulfide isomerase/thioredoxin